jgi:hypothetical protein
MSDIPLVVRIDRLVLDGIEFDAHLSERLGDAVVSELSRLLGKTPARPLTLIDSTPSVRGHDIRLGRRPTAGSLGRSVAASVYSGLIDRGTTP